jgi:anti-sigma B factor antagonist
MLYRVKGCFPYRTIGAATIIELQGNLRTGITDEQLRATVDRLVQEGHCLIALDMSRVPYADPGGIGEIVRSYTTAQRNRGRLVILAPQQKLIDILNLTKLSTVLEIFATQSEALARLSAPCL